MSQLKIKTPQGNFVVLWEGRKASTAKPAEWVFLALFISALTLIMQTFVHAIALKDQDEETIKVND